MTWYNKINFVSYQMHIIFPCTINLIELVYYDPYRLCIEGKIMLNMNEIITEEQN